MKNSIKTTMGAAMLSLCGVFAAQAQDVVGYDARPKTERIESAIRGFNVDNIPRRSIYYFNIDLTFNQASAPHRMPNGVTVTQFNAVAAVPLGQPQFAYLGQSFTELSNWTSDFCARNAQGRENWSWIERDNLTVQPTETGTYEIGYNFSCYLR